MGTLERPIRPCVIGKTFSFWFPTVIPIFLPRQDLRSIFFVVSFVVVPLLFLSLFPLFWVCNLQNFSCTFDLVFITCIPLLLILESFFSILAVILLFFKVRHAGYEHGARQSSIFFSSTHIYKAGTHEKAAPHPWRICA